MTAVSSASAPTAAAAAQQHQQPQQHHNVAQGSLQLFEEGFKAYRKLIDHDYMEHSKLTHALATLLRGLPADGWMADLGCGDLGLLAPILSALPLGGFVGVDATAEVLPLAAARLGATTAAYPCEWACSDLLDWSEARREAVLGDDRVPPLLSVVTCLFSLHHLADPLKQRALTALRPCMAPGGCVVVADVFRLDGEGREAYLARYCARAEKDWVALEAGTSIHHSSLSSCRTLFPTPFPVLTRLPTRLLPHPLYGTRLPPRIHTDRGKGAYFGARAQQRFSQRATGLCGLGQGRGVDGRVGVEWNARGGGAGGLDASSRRRGGKGKGKRGQGGGAAGGENMKERKDSRGIFGCEHNQSCRSFVLLSPTLSSLPFIDDVQAISVAFLASLPGLAAHSRPPSLIHIPRKSTTHSVHTCVESGKRTRKPKRKDTKISPSFHTSFSSFFRLDVGGAFSIIRPRREEARREGREGAPHRHTPGALLLLLLLFPFPRACLRSTSAAAGEAEEAEEASSHLHLLLLHLQEEEAVVEEQGRAPHFLLLLLLLLLLLSAGRQCQWWSVCQ